MAGAGAEAISAAAPAARASSSAVASWRQHILLYTMLSRQRHTARLHPAAGPRSFFKRWNIARESHAWHTQPYVSQLRAC